MEKNVSLRMNLLLALAVAASPAQAAAVKGQPAPAATLNALDGKSWNIPASARASKVTVVNFWATWCAPCVKELPELGRLYQENRAKGMAFVAVNAAESAPAATRFAARVKAQYPILLDPGKTVMKGWGVNGLPVTFVIDRKGVIRHRIDAETSYAELKRLIAPIMAEK